jgi:hypothetical protein
LAKFLREGTMVSLECVARRYVWEGGKRVPRANAAVEECEEKNPEGQCCGSSSGRLMASDEIVRLCTLTPRASLLTPRASLLAGVRYRHVSYFLEPSG